MYKASAQTLLPTSIIGSLPRPAWHTLSLGRRSFLEAMVNARWREQYEDAVSAHLRAQEIAGAERSDDPRQHTRFELIVQNVPAGRRGCGNRGRCEFHLAR